MQNRRIYLITLFVSLIFVALPLFCKSDISNVISGIGCSALAAAVMALFLERADAVREKKKIQQSRYIYFRQFYNQITMLIERIIWFDERMDDNGFDWNLDVSAYSTLRYMVWASSKYKERDLRYEEALTVLKKLETKYGKEEMSNCSIQEKEKIHKMFSIIAGSSQSFISFAQGIKEDRLPLAVSDYLSISENDSIQLNVQLIIGTMIKKRNAYDNAISSLICLAEKVRAIGGYDDGVSVGLHGSISILDN